MHTISTYLSTHTNTVSTVIVILLGVGEVLYQKYGLRGPDCEGIPQDRRSLFYFKITPPQ